MGGGTSTAFRGTRYLNMRGWNPTGSGKDFRLFTHNNQKFYYHQSRLVSILFGESDIAQGGSDV